MIITQKRNMLGWMTAVLLILYAIGLFATKANASTALLAQRLQFCLEILIPSLYGSMALCNLLVLSGGVKILGRMFSVLGRLLHCPVSAVGVFVLSQIAGYPVGNLMLRHLTETGELTADEAKRFASLCFGGGPSFLVGFAGAQMLGSAAAGWLLFISCFLANLVAAILLRPKQTIWDTEGEKASRIHPAAMAVKAAEQSMQSLLRICAVVLLAGVIWFLLEQLGIIGVLSKIGYVFGLTPAQSQAILGAVADVTQLSAVCRSGLPFEILLPLMGALLSFGGVCVHMQCISLGVSGIHLTAMLRIRLLTALLAAGICMLLLPLFSFDRVIEVFAPICKVSASGSCLPALLILCTGFPIISKKD